MGISHQEFLYEYWNKRPLLVRGVFTEQELGFVSPEEVLGLSQEDGIESRFMAYDRGLQSTKLAYGPFKDKYFFSELPQKDWTILVQQLDQLLVPAEELKSAFSFLPYWLFDDIMVSVAAPGGGVGPHVDQYDVFLIQGAGKRRWQYSDQVIENVEYIEGLDFKILKNGKLSQEEVTQAGDVLYLPPGFAHDGIAEGDDWCMTYSVGVRSPSLQDVLVSLVAKVDRNDLIRFTPQVSSSSAKIDSGVVSKLNDAAIEILKSYLNQDFYAEQFTPCPDDEKPFDLKGAEETGLEAWMTKGPAEQGSILIRVQPDQQLTYTESSDKPNQIKVFFMDQNLIFKHDPQVVDLISSRKIGLSQLGSNRDLQEFCKVLLGHGVLYVQECDEI